MWNSPYRIRKAETTVLCKKCKTRLFIERTCHEVHMFCPTCQKKAELAEYVSQTDDVMEDFMSQVYCDRM